MLTIETIEPGKSYAAKFKLENMPIDQYGRLGGQYSLSDLPIAKMVPMKDLVFCFKEIQKRSW